MEGLREESSGPGLELTILRGEGQGASWPLDRPLVAGSRRDAELYLKDSAVDWNHARFQPESEGGYSVEDLGSAQGIRVNGEKAARSPLSPGDIVLLGETLVGVFELGASPAEPSAAALEETRSARSSAAAPARAAGARSVGSSPRKPLRQQLVEAQSLLTASERERDSARLELDELRATLREAELRQNLLEAERERNEREASEAGIQSVRAETERSTLRDTLENESARLNRRLLEAESALADECRGRQGFEAEVDLLRERLGDAERREDAARAAVLELERDRARLDGELRALQGGQSQLEEDRDRHAAEESALRARLEGVLLEQPATIRREVERETVALTAELERASERVDRFLAELEELRAERLSLRTEVAERSAQNATLEERLRVQLESGERLEHDRESLAARLEQSEEAAAMAQHDLVALRKLHAEAEREATRAVSSNESDRRRAKEAESELARLREALEFERAAALQSNAEAKEARTRAERLEVDLRAELAELNRQLEGLERRWRDEERRADALESERGRLETELALLGDYVEELKRAAAGRAEPAPALGFASGLGFASADPLDAAPEGRGRASEVFGSRAELDRRSTGRVAASSPAPPGESSSAPEAVFGGELEEAAPAAPRFAGDAARGLEVEPSGEASKSKPRSRRSRKK